MLKIAINITKYRFIAIFSIYSYVIAIIAINAMKVSVQVVATEL